MTNINILEIINYLSMNSSAVSQNNSVHANNTDVNNADLNNIDSNIFRNHLLTTSLGNFRNHPYDHADPGRIPFSLTATEPQPPTTNPLPSNFALHSSDGIPLTLEERLQRSREDRLVEAMKFREQNKSTIERLSNNI